VCVAAACAETPTPDASAAPAATEAAAVAVKPGIDVLLETQRALVAGKRAGLITNHTGRTSAGLSTIDALFNADGIQLVSLFGPEHGLRGELGAGATVESGRDPRTGLPFHSLYGETRKPTPEMLADVDVLIYDIQDIGSRYYTYMWTMTLALQAAAENGKAFVVLDRPDPIGGELVQGNVLDSAYATFVGLYPVPMRHGMTVGEMARFVNGEYGIGADLTVVGAEGWTRSRWYDATDLEWLAPSPNMPDLEAATHDPGTCLFEGVNISVGRGTPDAFKQIGAPWLDAGAVIRRLGERAIPGVRFEPTTFTPSKPADAKYDGVSVNGIRFVVTDRTTYDPTRAAITVLQEIRAVHPTQVEFNIRHFDRLAGTDRVRLGIESGATIEEITADWGAQIAAFESKRAQYLIYR
jgi:beta-N-acetylhexosaminidase